MAALLAQGRPVVALCRNPESLADLRHPALRIAAGDLRDPAAWAPLLTPGGSVFHLAAVRNSPRSPRPRDAGGQRRGHPRPGPARPASGVVARFVHVSTALIYGPAEAGRARTEADDLDRSSAYVRSKAEAVEGIRALVRAGLPAVTVCPSIVFGPDHPSRPNRVTSEIRRLLRGGPRIWLAGGRQVRDLVFVDDVVGGLLAAEERGGVGEEYILGGEEVSPRELSRRVGGGIALSLPAGAALGIAGIVDRLRRNDAGAGYATAVRNLLQGVAFRLGKARRELGYRPMPLMEGLAPYSRLASTHEGRGEKMIEIETAKPAFRLEEAAEPSLRERQRRSWDRVAASVRDFAAAPSTQYYRRCEIALIEHAVGDLRGKRILKLDLWNEAFNTRILDWMRSRGAEVVGLDLSRVVAERARRNALAEGGPLALLRADIRELPFPAGSFDVVYTMGTIEHIDEYPQSLREIHRVLRPGGRAIVGVPHKWNVFLRPLMVWILDAFGQYLYAPEKSFSSGELRRDLESAGLRPIERTGILTLPGYLRMADLFFYTRGIPLYRLSPLFLAPFQYLETRWRWPGRFGYLLTWIAGKP